ncbi:hypothetical protein MANY_05280 [Mycolicibacterium anyangense]|uniref:Polysaccharide biosynthesis protein C-terminal domain-containing protein n=1 Tax=Mycolicibacterium anyangense TaxID=1431246 RepID=A0A6N4W709_9MYCO|nr:hypothetical protein [Mycolicibacterium anyangense]BBZ75191.1 hypothetical protein MANY_05280 [Mycolicibacterium anyangense]
MSEVSSPAPPTVSRIGKTVLAAVWMYGGRGVGLLWTLAVIKRLGIADYGLYAMGFALAAIICAPLDNPFNVRALRESEERFLRERTTRVGLGLLLMAAGIAVVDVHYIAWFGLVVGGGELVFNAYKSRDLRDGHPDRVMRRDTVRQISSIALASAYLFAAAAPTLLTASLLYCVPYAVIAALAVLTVRGHRPELPGPPRLVAALVMEHLGNALYIQGDVLLLGFLTDSRVAGLYSVASVMAWAVAALGQSYVATYHEPLRESGGDLASGPPRKSIVTVSVVAMLLILLVGIGLVVSPAPRELGVAMVLMSVFCCMRTANYIYTAVLYMQHRDLLRAWAAVGLVPVKLACVAGLAPLGAVGAAVASVLTDAVLLALYLKILYRRGG